MRSSRICPRLSLSSCCEFQKNEKIIISDWFFGSALKIAAERPFTTASQNNVRPIFFRIERMTLDSGRLANRFATKCAGSVQHRAFFFFFDITFFHLTEIFK